MISRTRWRKSSRSGATESACVELAHALDAIRDSKNPAGPLLRADVPAMVAVIKAGRLD